MLTNLKEIYNMLEEINRTGKSKEDLLRSHLTNVIFGKTLRKVLEYITDTSKQFNLKKIEHFVYFDDPVAAENQTVDGIFQMLDYLNEKDDDPSDEEIDYLGKVSSSDAETIEVVTRILNKFSGTGLTNEQILEIIKE